MGSQEQGVRMAALVMLVVFVCVCGADLGQDQHHHPQGQHQPTAEGGVVSPSKEYENLLHDLENYEKPQLPHVAPINEVYNQIDGPVYDKYNVDKQDTVDEQDNDDGIPPYLAIIVPSLVIGLAALVFNVAVYSIESNKSGSRSTESFFNFLPKPQVMCTKFMEY